MDLLHVVIQQVTDLVPTHVRREANKIDDCLANEGVSNPSSSLDSSWENILDETLKQRCHSLALLDLDHPNQVTHGFPGSENLAVAKRVGNNGYVREVPSVISTPSITSLVHALTTEPCAPSLDHSSTWHNDQRMSREVGMCTRLEFLRTKKEMRPLFPTNERTSSVLVNIVSKCGRMLQNSGKIMSWLVLVIIVTHSTQARRALHSCVWLFMAPRKRKAKPSIQCKTRVALAVEEVVTHYHFVVALADKETMLNLEEVRIVCAYRKDEGIDKQAGDITPNLGCTRNRETKSHYTMELYRHVKTMFAQGMRSPEREFRKFIQRLVALE